MKRCKQHFNPELYFISFLCRGLRNIFLLVPLLVFYLFSLSSSTVFPSSLFLCFCILFHRSSSNSSKKGWLHFPCFCNEDTSSGEEVEPVLPYCYTSYSLCCFSTHYAFTAGAIQLCELLFINRMQLMREVSEWQLQRGIDMFGKWSGIVQQNVVCGRRDSGVECP